MSRIAPIIPWMCSDRISSRLSGRATRRNGISPTWRILRITFRFSVSGRANRAPQLCPGSRCGRGNRRRRACSGTVRTGRGHHGSAREAELISLLIVNGEIAFDANRAVIVDGDFGIGHEKAIVTNVSSRESADNIRIAHSTSLSAPASRGRLQNHHWLPLQAVGYVLDSSRCNTILALRCCHFNGRFED